MERWRSEDEAARAYEAFRSQSKASDGDEPYASTSAHYDPREASPTSPRPAGTIPMLTPMSIPILGTIILTHLILRSSHPYLRLIHQPRLCPPSTFTITCVSTRSRKSQY